MRSPKGFLWQNSGNLPGRLKSPVGAIRSCRVSERAGAASDPTVDLLATRPFPRMAAALRTRKGSVLRRWGDAGQKLLPPPAAPTPHQLRRPPPPNLHPTVQAPP